MFDWSLARDSFVTLLAGLRFTVEYAAIVMGLSLALAIPVAYARLSRHRAVRLLAGAYVGLIRSTPLLIQLVYIYFALPVVGITLSAPVAGVVGMTLHYTAYITEVYRSGIQAIPRGQRDAAVSIGMRPLTISTRVVFPQAFRIMVPTLGNYFISAIKDTSLLSVITVQELLFSGQIIAERTYDYFTLYTEVFAMYLVLGTLAIIGVKYVERYFARGRGSAPSQRRGPGLSGPGLSGPGLGDTRAA